MRFTNDTYRRINHPTKFERWWDGLPTWVESMMIVVKMCFVALVIMVIYHHSK